MNCQISQVIPLDGTLLISGAPCDCKMSDYVLLKKVKIYILLKTNKTGFFFHIRTVYLDIIKVLFIHQLIH